MFVCLIRHEISSFNAAVCRDLIFLCDLSFLRKARDAPLCFPEPWLGFLTLVRTHATTP